MNNLWLTWSVWWFDEMLCENVVLFSLVESLWDRFIQECGAELIEANSHGQQ